MNTIDLLRDQIRSDFKASYLLNDEAHREDHFSTVEKTAIELNTRMQMGYDPKLLLMGAWFHDLFAWSRKDHHVLSAKWVRTTEYPCITTLSQQQRWELEQACAEHRASYIGSYSSPLSELLSAADRGIPQGVKPLLKRSEIFHISRGRDPAYAKEAARRHVYDKYAKETGYARYPTFYREAFQPELERLWEEVERLR